MTINDPFFELRGNTGGRRNCWLSMFHLRPWWVDDQTTFGAIRALISAGLSVPQDYSVIRSGDVPASAFYYPALTSVQEHLETLAGLGHEIPLESMRARRKEQHNPSHSSQKQELIERESAATLHYPGSELLTICLLATEGLAH